MTHRYRIPNKSRLVQSKVRTALKRVRATLLDPATSSLYEASRAVFQLASKVLPRIGKPTYEPVYLAEDADPDPGAWNRNLDSIEEDLRTLFEESEVLNDLRTEVSNAATLAAKELEAKANLTQSLLTDLRLVSGQLDQEVIVATDDFLDLSKVDFGFPLQLPQAEVDVSHGAVSLQRTNSFSVVTEDARVEVTPLSPNLKREPTPDNTMRFYEGKFYAPLGDGRPEGGRWHLEEKVRPGVTVPGDSVVYTMNDESGKNIFNEFPDLRREAESRPQGFPLRPEDIVILDRGATLTELLTSRRRFVDGNADSFWECEFVVAAPQLDALAQQTISPSDTDQDVQVELTPQELRARAAREDIDRFDFEVEIVVHLGRRQLVNFIVINPMNFDETAWLEVFDVSTSETTDSAFLPIEGFDEQIFENVLTDEANAELSDGEARTVLAPSKYSYRGQGVYSFSPREVSRVRIRLRQRTPVPNHYERVAIQLTRTLTHTETKVKTSCFPAGTKIWTPFGQFPIEKIAERANVFSYDEGDEKIQIEFVTKVLEHKPTQVYRVTHSKGVLRVTPNHRVLTHEGWVRVDKLVPGYHVLIWMDEGGRARPATVKCVEGDTVEKVYNLHTTGSHNYIADGVIAHSFTHFPRLRSLWCQLRGAHG